MKANTGQSNNKKPLLLFIQILTIYGKKRQM